MPSKRWPLWVLGPLLYSGIATALAPWIIPGSMTTGAMVLVALIGSMVALGALETALRGALPRDPAAIAGLVALGLALAAARLEGPAWLHAALLIASSAGLGAAFGAWIGERMTDSSVIVTAAVCLALFDVWSVFFGPASLALSGGLLSLLLLSAPAPGGWTKFLGISDLILTALLIQLGVRLGIARSKSLLAGWLGIGLATGQALLTQRAAPALPWIGLCFCVMAWPVLRPGREGWRRTGRWAAGTAVVLGVATVVVLLRRL